MPPLPINTGTTWTIKNSHHLCTGIILMAIVGRLREIQIQWSIDKHGDRDLDKYHVRLR